MPGRALRRARRIPDQDFIEVLRLNPLNARKGITTNKFYRLRSVEEYLPVESPQCPEGHYDRGGATSGTVGGQWG